MNSDHSPLKTHDSQESSSTSGKSFITASTVPIKNRDWIWPGWIARGEVHLLAGASATAVKTVAIDIAAMCSMGDLGETQWPDYTPVKSVNRVLIWSSRSEWSVAIIPQLEAAKADKKYVTLVENRDFNNITVNFNLKRDYVNIEKWMEAHGGFDLLVILPIELAANGSLKTFNGADLMLRLLSEIAKRQHCAVLGVTDRVFEASRSLIKRVPSGLANSYYLQVVMLCTQDQSWSADPNITGCVLVQARSEFDDEIAVGGLRYQVEKKNLPSTNGVSILSNVIHWDTELNSKSVENLNEATQAGTYDRSRGLEKKAEFFVLDLLANQQYSAKEIEAAAKEHGISLATLRRAKQNLQAAGRIGKEKERGGRGRTFWFLAAPNPTHVKFDTLKKIPELNSPLKETLASRFGNDKSEDTQLIERTQQNEPSELSVELNKLEQHGQNEKIEIKKQVEQVEPNELVRSHDAVDLFESTALFAADPVVSMVASVPLRACDMGPALISIESPLAANAELDERSSLAATMAEKRKLKLKKARRSIDLLSAKALAGSLPNELSEELALLLQDEQDADFSKNTQHAHNGLIELVEPIELIDSRAVVASVIQNEALLVDPEVHKTATLNSDHFDSESAIGHDALQPAVVAEISGLLGLTATPAEKRKLDLKEARRTIEHLAAVALAGSHPTENTFVKRSIARGIESAFIKHDENFERKL